MSKHILDIINNRKAIDDGPGEHILESPNNLNPIDGGRGNPGFSPEFVELARDLQSHILTSHGFDRAHYLFVSFREDEELITKYLLGMLAHNAFERVMIRNAIDDPNTREAMSESLKRAAAKWERGAPGQISLEDHAVLADVRVVSEFEVFRRRTAERAAKFGKTETDAAKQMAARPPFTVNVLLTRQGYEKLGIPAPQEPAFLGGMSRASSPLKDPHPETWQRADAWKKLDALVVVAYDPADGEKGVVQAQKIATFRRIIKQHADILFEELGHVLRVASGKYPIEPFGFRDGISQPAFYESQREHSMAYRPPPNREWDPAAPLSLVLRPDPNSRARFACGSYFVFRKLEQDLKGFVEQSENLAADRGWSAKELQEKFVGRTRAGDPLAPSGGTINDFDFKADPLGEACPFHAHVRKSNPRGDVLPSYDPRSHRILRRGMPYGPLVKRQDDGTPILPLVFGPIDPPVEADPDVDEDEKKLREAEKEKVGLLFLCAQGDIGSQFEHLQARWSNKADHPRGRRTAVDTVIGQLSRGEENLLAIDTKGRPFTAGLVDDYKPTVTLKGGAYFFAPSISFLRALLTDLLSDG